MLSRMFLSNKESWNAVNAVVSCCARIALVCTMLCSLSGCNGSALARWLSGADMQQNPQKISSNVLPPPPATVVTPSPEALNADTKTDIHAESKYSTAVHSLLIQQQFDTLDAMADSLRESKIKFSGGSWKLLTFYGGLLEFPGRNVVGQGDWQIRILLLQRWASLKPE